MDIAHETLVAVAKSWGLFYLIGLSLAVLVYTFWPGNSARFERARHSIIDDEDEPGDGPGDGPGGEMRAEPGDRSGGGAWR